MWYFAADGELVFKLYSPFFNCSRFLMPLGTLTSILEFLLRTLTLTDLIKSILLST